jgi:hypothetical protein
MPPHTALTPSLYLPILPNIFTWITTPYLTACMFSYLPTSMPLSPHSSLSVYVYFLIPPYLTACVVSQTSFSCSVYGLRPKSLLYGMYYLIPSDIIKHPNLLNKRTQHKILS